MDKWPDWLRWVLVIPGAILGAIIAPAFFQIILSFYGWDNRYVHACVNYSLDQVGFVLGAICVAPKAKSIVGTVAYLLIAIPTACLLVVAVRDLIGGASFSYWDDNYHIPNWMAITFFLSGTAIAGWAVFVQWQEDLAKMRQGAVSRKGGNTTMATLIPSEHGLPAWYEIKPVDFRRLSPAQQTEVMRGVEVPQELKHWPLNMQHAKVWLDRATQPGPEGAHIFTDEEADVAESLLVMELLERGEEDIWDTPADTSPQAQEDDEIARLKAIIQSDMRAGLIPNQELGPEWEEAQRQRIRARVGRQS